MSTQQAPHTAPPPPPPAGSTSPSDGSSLAPRLVLVVLPLLVAVVVGVTRPEVYTALVNSPQAIAIVAGIIAAIVGWSAILRRFLRNEWAITALVLLPLAVVGYLFIAPYYADDVVVDEALPGLETSAVTAEEPASDGVTADDPAAAATASGEAAGGGDVPGEDGAPATTSDDAGQDPVADGAAGAAAIPEAGAAEEPEAEADHAAEPDVAAAEDVVDGAEEPAAPTGPVQLTTGSFVGLDNHFAEGAAAIYDLEDGSSIVRLEDVNLQQVPEAVVYLVPGIDQQGLADGSIDLGPLTGNVGSSNYAIPADVDLAAGDWTVLVWCEVFASPVGAASQAAVVG